MQTIKDYLPFIIWGLVIIAAGIVMYKSRKEDYKFNQQEDEDNDSNVIEMNYDWDCEDIRHLN